MSVSASRSEAATTSAPAAWTPSTSARRSSMAPYVFGYCTSTPQTVAALVVGTSKPEKNWLPERWASLAAALYTEFALQPVIVGGPSAAERAVADVILRESGVPVLDALGDDVRKLLWLLDGARLVVSPDTGPLHIARALETPVVGLYGYTNPRRYGPYRRYENLVVDGYARWPGEDYPCSMVHRPGGMARVTLEMVLAKVELALRS